MILQDWKKKSMLGPTNFNSKINLSKQKIRNVRTTRMSILARIFSNQINYFTFWITFEFNQLNYFSYFTLGKIMTFWKNPIDNKMIINIILELNWSKIEQGILKNSFYCFLEGKRFNIYGQLWHLKFLPTIILGNCFLKGNYRHWH